MQPTKMHLIDCKERFTVLHKNKFYEKVLIPNAHGCMEWMGKTNIFGCGVMYNVESSIRMLAHKFSYIMHIGHIPDEFGVIQTCHNSRCVAPNHLILSHPLG